MLQGEWRSVWLSVYKCGTNLHDPCKDKQTKCCGMSLEISRCILVRINECYAASAHWNHFVCMSREMRGRSWRLTGNKPSAVGDTQLHSRRRGSLIMPCGVIWVPNQDAWHAAVHAACHEKGHAVLYLRGGNVGDHSVSDDGDGQGDEHDDAAKTHAIRNKRYSHCEELVRRQSQS